MYPSYTVGTNVENGEWSEKLLVSMAWYIYPSSIGRVGLLFLFAPVADFGDKSISLLTEQWIKDEQISRSCGEFTKRDRQDPDVGLFLPQNSIQRMRDRRS